MYELPTSITVNGIQHPIRNQGDYRMVLDCFTALNDETISKNERIVACLCIFLEEITDISQIYELPDLEKVSKEVMKFLNCGSDDNEKQQPFRVIDWEKDETLICSAINKIAGKEIRTEPYIHWWTFMGYYVAIGESALATVVSIRYKKARNEKLEKHERKFINDNPQYFNLDMRTIQQREDDEWIKSVWNKDKKSDE